VPAHRLDPSLDVGRDLVDVEVEEPRARRGLAACHRTEIAAPELDPAGVAARPGEHGCLHVLDPLLRARRAVQRSVRDGQEALDACIVGERERGSAVRQGRHARASAEDHARGVDVLADHDEPAGSVRGHDAPFAKWSRSRKVFAHALVRRRRLSTITGGRSSIASSSPYGFRRS
jgi:hypothetical protein